MTRKVSLLSRRGKDDSQPTPVEELIQLPDSAPTAPWPEELIAHLRLPCQQMATTSKLEYSKPRGYAPRLRVAPVAPGPLAKAMQAPVKRQRERAADISVEGHRPAHLALRRIPRLLPPRATLSGLSDLGAIKPLSWEMAQPDMLAWPWCTIGKIDYWTEGRQRPGGTGFLVGRNLMVTASHVMPWDYSGNCSVRFIPAFTPDRIPPFGETWVSQWYGHRHDGFWDMAFQADAKDYVICRLQDPIGDICGWMGTRSFSDHKKYLRRGYMSGGYPQYAGDWPRAEMDISIRDVDGDNDGRELEAVLFGGPGWSGGPLFAWFGDDLRAVGVCHGKETEMVFPWYVVNLVFAGGKHLIDLIRYGQANWPA